MNDDLLFLDEGEEDLEEQEHTKTWKILVVDDEPEVHAVTKLALSDFTLNNVGLTFLSAYSGAEAIDIFREHSDIAVVLLDVVMESDDAGLIVADKIRNELNNQFTRIILRTGQPGQAPEKHVIVNYDINDYKSKTELTAQKLFTVMIAALRSYRDIITIEQNRVGLSKVLSASTDLFSCRSLGKFVEGLVQQLSSVLGCAQSAVFVTPELIDASMPGRDDPMDLKVFAGHGDYANVFGMPIEKVLDSDVLDKCKQVFSSRSMYVGDDQILAYCHSKHFGGSLLFMSDTNRYVNDISIDMVRLFTDSIQVAFENILMIRESRLTQNELIERLCRAMDYTAPTNNHIPRLVAISALLADKLGMPEADVDRLKVAVPMHDVGNYRLPEMMLNRKGPLSFKEKTDMQRHADMGAGFLSDSENKTVQLAAKLALQHHERWDGTGYPNKLSGEKIILESRVAAAADVFDALYNKRPFKEAWDIAEVLGFFESERNKAFDPKVVDAIIACKEELVALQTSMRDGQSIYSR